MVAMEDIYEEATRGIDVPEATANRVRGLIQDAASLEIDFTWLGAFVRTLPQPPYGARKILGRFSSMLEAQNFAWAWLTGPRGVVKDVQFVKTGPNTFGIDIGALVSDIRDYLTNRSA